jgi:hypothetical protein
MGQLCGDALCCQGYYLEGHNFRGLVSNFGMHPQFNQFSFTTKQASNSLRPKCFAELDHYSFQEYSGIPAVCFWQIFVKDAPFVFIAFFSSSSSCSSCGVHPSFQRWTAISGDLTSHLKSGGVDYRFEGHSCSVAGLTRKPICFSDVHRRQARFNSRSLIARPLPRFKFRRAHHFTGLSDLFLWLLVFWRVLASFVWFW